MLKASRDLVWSPVKAFVCVVGIVIVCVNVAVSCGPGVGKVCATRGDGPWETQWCVCVSQTRWHAGQKLVGASKGRIVQKLVSS